MTDLFDIKRKIRKCFKDSIGIDLSVAEFNCEGYELPSFYKRMYEFLLVGVESVNVEDFVVVCVKESESVIELSKRKRYFEAAFKKQVVFYFGEISYRTRRRLEVRRVSFIHGDQYLFVPFLGIFGIPLFKEIWDLSINLSLSAHRIVLGYLNGIVANGDNGKTISKKLNLSQMSVSNGLKELELHQYCHLIQERTSKILKFPDKAKLWESIERKLTSPAKRILYVSSPPANAYQAGLSALSVKTLLAYDGHPIYAISNNVYKEIQSTLKLMGEGDGIRLEVWKWAPHEFSTKEIVDPFSLALSLREESDERVLIAIDQMIKDALK